MIIDSIFDDGWLSPAPGRELNRAQELELHLRLNASAIDAAINVLCSGRPDKAKAILCEALAQSRIALGEDGNG